MEHPGFLRPHGECSEDVLASKKVDDNVFDLSKKGEDYFRSFIDDLPNSKGIIEPHDQRPPVKMFHSEEHLKKATVPSLLKAMQQEKLKQCIV